MRIGISLIFMLIMVGGIALWVAALVDLLRRPANEWTASGQNQLVLAAVVLLANVLGAVLYWFIARPRFTNGGFATN